MCCSSEAPDAFHQTWRRARRAHRCRWCDATIEPGHLYRYTSGVWDHEGASFKHCARCALLMDELERRGADGLDLDAPCDAVLPPDDPASAWAFETAEETQARAAAAVEAQRANQAAYEARLRARAQEGA